MISCLTVGTKTVCELFTPRPSRPSWEHTGRLKNCVARVDHLSPEALRPIFEIVSGVVHGCLE